MADDHFAPLRNAISLSVSYERLAVRRNGVEARLRLQTSISPWRKLWPSIFAMEAIFPAPKACEGDARHRITTTERRKIKGVLLDKDIVN